MMDKVNIIENLKELEGFLFREYGKAKDDIDTWYFRFNAVSDARELLKEKEAVEPEVEVLNEIDRIYRCPKCHKHFFYEKQKYCDQCGQEVKWE